VLDEDSLTHFAKALCLPLDAQKYLLLSPLSRLGVAAVADSECALRVEWPTSSRSAPPDTYHSSTPHLPSACNVCRWSCRFGMNVIARAMKVRNQLLHGGTAPVQRGSSAGTAIIDLPGPPVALAQAPQPSVPLKCAYTPTAFVL
jgi:hypothetical protein